MVFKIHFKRYLLRDEISRSALAPYATTILSSNLVLIKRFSRRAAAIKCRYEMDRRLNLGNQVETGTFYAFCCDFW